MILHHNAIYRLVVPMLMLLMSTAAAAQDRFANVEIEAIAVSDGVYMLTGMGGNMGLSVGKDGAFLVDDQFAPLTPKLKQTIAALSDKPVQFVINTHLHPDHTGGNENLGESGSIVIAHDLVRERLETGYYVEMRSYFEPPKSGKALPVLTFSESMTFHYNDDEIRVIHTPPAHTDTDSIVFFTGANVIHMGDTYRNTSYPVVDIANAGSIAGTIAVAERVIAMADTDTKIIPGHGTLATVDDLRAWHTMMVTIRERVKNGIEAGHSIGEILAADPTGDFDDEWSSEGMPGHRFAWYIYNELAGN